MKPNWIKFDSQSPGLPEYRHVLVMVAEEEDKGLPPAVAVGYLRCWSDNCNFFVVPGVGRNVTHWADCLGDDFITPPISLANGDTFQMKQREGK